MVAEAQLGFMRTFDIRIREAYLKTVTNFKVVRICWVEFPFRIWVRIFSHYMYNTQFERWLLCFCSKFSYET